jgi:hypothetical protein
VLFAFCTFARSDTLTDSKARSFLTALCRSDSDIVQFIEPSELKLCGRLGIHYDDVLVKSLIGQDLDSATRASILSDLSKYDIKITAPDSIYQKLSLSRPNVAGVREFYFKNGKFVLTSTYQSRNWHQLESEHFRFRFDDSSLINSYCIDQLEDFFVATATALGYTQPQLDLIRREKIEYLLCHDPQEVSALTGYDSRGMYELASDRIISCYNAHYHELVHLLVNFRLQQSPLWTHPFLQEGIAVALGGRGGIDRRGVEEMAAYLIASKMANASDLFSTDGFNETHSTISYPISGLYCSFLLKQIGSERFIKLYRKYSGSQEQVNSMLIPEGELPPDSLWMDFVSKLTDVHLMGLASTDSDFNEIYRDSSLIIAEGPDQFLFKTRERALIGRDSRFSGYSSSVFEEQFRDRKYRGERYAIVANADEIKLYDLYTNNLIANLVGAFRIPPVTISSDSGLYRFTVAKNVFDDDLRRELNSMK